MILCVCRNVRLREYIEAIANGLVPPEIGTGCGTCKEWLETMPIWDFKCTQCDSTFEAFVPSSERDNVRCPTCNVKTEVQLGASSFNLKGKDWYKGGFSSMSKSSK